MALPTKCQTPDVNYSTSIAPYGVVVHIDFPNMKSISKKQAELLERNIHNALELALAATPGVIYD